MSVCASVRQYVRQSRTFASHHHMSPRGLEQIKTPKSRRFFIHDYYRIGIEIKKEEETLATAKTNGIRNTVNYNILLEEISLTRSLFRKITHSMSRQIHFPRESD